MKLHDIPRGTLCFVADDHWCACGLPTGERVMIGNEDEKRFVVPVSDIVSKRVKNKSFIWCLVQGIGLAMLPTDSEVNVES